MRRFQSVVSILAFVIMSGCVGAQSPHGIVLEGSHSAQPVGSVSIAPDASLHVDVGTVRGVVTDEEMRPLPNATVTLQSQQVSVNTSEEGAYGFSGVPVGEQILEVQAEGFEGAAKKIIVESEVDAKVDFGLKRLVSAPSYYTSIPRKFHIQAGQATLDSWSQLADQSRFWCGPSCTTQFPVEAMPVQILMEGDWPQPTNPALNQEVVVLLTHYGRLTPDGSKQWITGDLHVKWRQNDTQFPRHFEGTSVYLNVTGGPTGNYEHALTIWSTWSYGERLPNGFTALPRD